MTPFESTGRRPVGGALQERLEMAKPQWPTRASFTQPTPRTRWLETIWSLGPWAAPSRGRRTPQSMVSLDFIDPNARPASSSSWPQHCRSGTVPPGTHPIDPPSKPPFSFRRGVGSGMSESEPCTLWAPMSFRQDEGATGVRSEANGGSSGLPGPLRPRAWGDGRGTRWRAPPGAQPHPLDR